MRFRAIKKVNLYFQIAFLSVEKIKKALKSLKSLLLKFDISIYLILYGDVRTKINSRQKSIIIKSENFYKTLNY